MVQTRASKQATLAFPEWGGARAGAGRKRCADRARLPHRARSLRARRFPLHVTLRVVEGLPSLRGDAEHDALRAALQAGADRFGFRLVHYSALSNHLHLVCEADDPRALARGLKGLSVRVARALNRLWERTGALLADRYHARELRTPREVRNALAYVLGNARHHGMRMAGLVDPCSSSILFDGWSEIRAPRSATWLARASTWLLCLGWRVHGLISIRDRPGTRSRVRTGDRIAGGGLSAGRS